MDVVVRELLKGSQTLYVDCGNYVWIVLLAKEIRGIPCKMTSYQI